MSGEQKHVPGQRGPRLFTKDYALICLVSLGTFLCLQSLMPVLPLYVKDLGGQDSDVGLILAIYSVAAVLSRAFAGSALDRWGRKRILVLGAFLNMVAVALYTVAATVPSILLLRLFHGFAFGVVTAACGVLAADLAPESRRAEALGYFSSFASVGTAVGPGIGLWLLTMNGLPLREYSLVFTTMAAVGVMEFLLSFFVGQPDRAPAGFQPSSPSRAGSSFFSRSAVPFSTTMVFASFAYGAIFSFGPLYLSPAGTQSVSAYFFVYATSMVVARPFAGMVADRFDRRLVAIPMMVTFAFGVGILAISPTLPVAIASALVCGVSFGALHPALLALVVDTATPAERGPAVSMYISSVDVGIAVGSPVLGLLAGHSGYAALFVISAAVVLLGLAYFLVQQRSAPGGERASSVPTS